MRRILHVAFNDLRLMVGDKAFLFWTLAFPMFFIMGFLALYLVMPVMQNVVQHLVDVGLSLSSQVLQQGGAR